MTEDPSGEGASRGAGHLPEPGAPLQRLVERLAATGSSVATAESLTGGLLGAGLTDVPGSSRVFRGGVISYATDVKQSVLGVPAEVVATHGVVSGECAAAMAGGVRDLLSATYGVATTGVAGPDPQEGHPPGTVWIAVAGHEAVEVRLLALTGDRAEVRARTCDAAAALLADVLRREVPDLG